MLDSTYTTYFPIDNNFLLWVTVKSAESNTVWYIVSDLYRKQYFLFKENKQTRYKSENPLDLYNKIK